MTDRFPWTDRQVEMLKRGRADREPFSVIAERLGCTRDAAIGKAQRLGLAPGRKPADPNRIPHRAKAAPPPRPKMPPPVARSPSYGGFEAVNAIRAVQRRARDPGLKPEALMPREPIICDASEGGITIVELRRHHCRWIAGETEDARYCGGMRTATSPYCERHAALVYARPQTKTEARIAADLRLRAARIARMKARRMERTSA